jgi:hypothetical protein
LAKHSLASSNPTSFNFLSEELKYTSLILLAAAKPTGSPGKFYPP